MKCKVFHGRNAPDLEKQFNDWTSETWVCETVTFLSTTNLCQDRGNNLVMAVFYEGDVFEVEIPAEESEEVPEGPVKERCVVCAAVQLPTVVERGPYAGRHKCSVCNKTYDHQGELKEEDQTNV